MKRGILIWLGLALLASGLFFLFRNAKPQSQLSPEVAARVARDLPLAVAHLENMHPEAALPLLMALNQDVPHDRAVLQNIAVGRVLEAMNPKPGIEAEPLKQTTLAHLQAWQAAHPDDWQCYALSGLYLEHLEDYAAAYAMFDAIAPLETTTNGGAQRPASRVGDTGMLYAMARTGLKLNKGPERADALRALLQAVDDQPDDLWLLLALIDEQVSHQDETVSKPLEKLLALAPLVAEPIRQAQRFDIVQAIATMQAAIPQSDWKAVTRSWGPIRNLMTPTDASQTDRKKNQRHPLDYVVDRIEGLSLPRVAPSPAIPLKFEPLELPPLLGAPAEVLDARWADFDFDRLPELCVLESTRLTIWSKKTGADQSPDPWTLLAECPVEGVERFLLGDLDDDPVELSPESTPGVTVRRADLDLVLYGKVGVRFLQCNRGDQKLSLAPPAKAVANLCDVPVTAAALADFDGDGDLDLLMANSQGLQLGFNRGGFQWETRPDSPAGVPAGQAISQLKACDLDRDHDIDVLTVSEGQVQMLTNLRHGTLRWSAIAGLDSSQVITNVAILDADANASWDLLLSGPTGQRLALSRTIEEGAWRITGDPPVSDQPTRAALLADLDNDGLEEIVHLADTVSLSRGGLGTFDEAPANWSVPSGVLARSGQSIDADGDGDLDLCLNLPAGIALWENQGGHQNAWVSLEVVAAQVKDSPPVPSGRVNHYGICSLLEARTSAGYQARVIEAQPVHFGLGPQGQAEIVRIVWQNGSPVNTIAPPRNQTIWELQTLTGSCPYLYTWDGEQYVFATDLLWAAPLGMPSPAGGLTPAREWEYLKIPGQLLKARDGQYQLQLTEELYEAAYFDKVQLIAVDHPAEVEIYSNEKVGPPTIAGKKIHTVSNPRVPVSARDQQDRDLLPAIRDLDEIYTKHWDHKFKQGWTERTELHLDLGTIPPATPVMLYLTGWIYPTDPAISMSIQENPGRAGLGIQPPSLEVPDGQGGWKLASPFIGFPGGKTKTIAVDLTHLLTPGDSRVRIVTSMELCWDQIFFTMNEPAAEVRETPLELVSADLHYRGCSARILHPQFGPERYDYARVDPMLYSSMEGRFTRYGDVRELLTEPDDRMVVLGCGDECTLTFRAAAPPPLGWTRDFVIHNVGWDKDCNPQNIYGKTVEPLPYAGMTGYPPAVPYPDSEQHRAYLRHYQTREQSDHAFRRYLFLQD
ncbi:MAG: CRTAC1 family protein [Planctomycetota bacterium]|nr:MAG: CRTAC1 family protein [Planctomycetota bacterium]